VIDKQVILRAQRGDTQAFQHIVEEHYEVSWRTAHILLRNGASTEDVLQEAWIDVWRGLPRLQHFQTLRSWVLTVVANRCRMTLRRSALMTVSLENTPDLLLLPGDIEDVLDQMVRQETSTEIRVALAMLSAEQQQVLELRYFAELELSEIALITSLPLGTIKSRLHRALHALRLVLQEKKEKLFLR